MIDTPETDAAALHDGTVVSADVARKLKRERDEARGLFQTAMELLKKYKDVGAEARDAFAIATDQCVVAQAKLREAIEERDEARAMLERKWHEEDAPLVRMMRERDEAREQIKDQAKRIKHLEGAAKMLKMTCCNELGCVEMAERVMHMLDEETLQKS
jgi:hypothetical protein